MVSRIATVPYTETRRLWPLTAEAQTYQVGDLIGLTETGYAAIFDQRQPLRFLGISEEQVQVPAAASAGQYRLCVDRPMLLSVRMSNASPHHVGYKAYARSRDEVQLQPGPFGNFAGVIVAVLNSSEVLLAPPHRSRPDVAGVRILPAEGDQVLGRFALHQTLFIPNTVPMTIILPPTTVTQPGDGIRFVKVTGNAAVTLAATAGDTIDGQSTLALTAAGSFAWLLSTGTSWIVLASRTS
ncbi:hypothetical protein HRbin36_01419 [bacterium HR36]|nr:hypothetical protein HRbin36_01419 [bacterium HR36]